MRIKAIFKENSNIIPANFGEVIVIKPDGPAFVDTSDATATELSILEGDTAYVNGEKIIGAIPKAQAAEITPSTHDVIVARKGVYTDGDIVVKGDENLVPENIVEGKEIYGVKGSHVNKGALELLYTEGAEITAEDWGSVDFGQNFNNSGVPTGGLNFSGAKIKKITFPDTQIISIGFPRNQLLEEYDSGSSMSASGTVGGMGQYIFYNCTNLKKLWMGENFLPFANYAFFGCTSLNEVHYRGTIDKWAEATRNVNVNRANPFGYSKAGCFYLGDSTEPLSEIDLTTAQTIELGAFWGFKDVTKATIGQSVTAIKGNAFQYCANLNSVILRGDTVKPLSNITAFTGTPIADGVGTISIQPITVDEATLVAEYKAATNWSTLAAQIKPFSEYAGGAEQ